MVSNQCRRWTSVTPKELYWSFGPGVLGDGRRNLTQFKYCFCLFHQFSVKSRYHFSRDNTFVPKHYFTTWKLEISLINYPKNSRYNKRRSARSESAMRVHSTSGLGHLIPQGRPHGSPERCRAWLVESPAPHHEERRTRACQLRRWRKLRWMWRVSVVFNDSAAMMLSVLLKWRFVCMLSFYN